VKEDKCKSLEFSCPKPCNGQVLIGGAIVRPTNITFVGACVDCGSTHYVDLSPLLKEMCNFTNVVH